MRSALLLTLLAAAVTASAHDLWIEPSSFRPAAGERVTAALRVGQKLQGEPLPRIPPLIDRFTLDDKPMLGFAGSDPAGIALVQRAGFQWIAYQSTAFPMTLELPKFEQYLRDEGLDATIKVRAQRPQNERFYRCAKSLIDAGSAPGGAIDAPLGFTLELVPHRKPRTGEALPLTLLFHGKPAANVLVIAMSKTDPGNAVRARTDARGRVALRIPHGGFWLIKAVHMQPAPPDSGADWESWWASITFEL